MKLLSIVIPSYNSRLRIQKLVLMIEKVKIPQVRIEIIVVDDASPDNAWEVIKKIQHITAIHHAQNTGKGGAVRTGLKKAKGDILFIQDDDLEYSPFDIPKIIAPILAGKVDVVFGSRRLNKKNKYSSSLYYFGGVFIDFVISIILRSHTTDAITGSKAFTKNVYKALLPIESNGFEIESEIAAKVVKRKFRLMEVPISYNPRTHAQGKNIRWHHAYPIFKTLIKYAWFS